MNATVRACDDVSGVSRAGGGMYVSSTPFAQVWMATKLSDIEIQRALGTRAGWTRRGNAITRTYEFPTFPAAIAFVNRIAEVAERMDHHPDIDIRYAKVTCNLSTHSAGGITLKDFKLAEAIDEQVKS